MRRCGHARAVILLGGWLLMAAPFTNGTANTKPTRDELSHCVNRCGSSQGGGVVGDFGMTRCVVRCLDREPDTAVHAPRRPDEHAPISQWEQVGAYDKAADCERERVQWEGDILRCVPAEHIYPPKEPAQK